MMVGSTAGARRATGRYRRSGRESFRRSWWPTRACLAIRPHRIEDFASPVRLHRRLPGSVDEEGFALAGPGRHCGGEHVEGLVAVAAELEMCAGRYRQRYAGAELDDLLISAELAPHAPR